MSTQEKITVFYHSPCLDGSTAAWAAYKKWGEEAHYIGINHGDMEDQKKQILSNIDEDMHVIFADYTPPHALMDEIANKVAEITIYDHHASAIRSMEGYKNDKVTTVFDEDRSGAAIVYDELFPKRKRPQVVDLAQMIDLEHSNRKDFFAISAYLDSLPIDHIGEALKSLDDVNELSLEKIIERGQPIRQYLATSIEKALDSMAWTKVSILPGTDPIYVPIINANPQYLGREFSIRLRELAEKSPPGFVALCWYEDKGEVRVSVRTNGIPDAGKVAAHIGSVELKHGHGGGGHSASAAAQFEIDQFNSLFRRFTQQEVFNAHQSTSVVVENPSAEEVGRAPRKRGSAK